MSVHIRLWKIACISLGWILSLNAQKDTVHLNEVAVVQKRTLQFAVGSTLETIDSEVLKVYRGQSLTEILNQESLIYLKQYGPGNLATTSFRGASSQQSVVTWNGFNVGSPLNGQFDLSLFPLSSFDQVQIQNGASSALWGSGAIGGAIHLSHTPDFTTHQTISGTLQSGSFSNQTQNLSYSYGSAKYSGRALLLHQRGLNDFGYVNPYTNEVEKQGNNALLNLALLSENHFRFNARNSINFHTWAQHTDREIPPALFDVSRSAQKDRVLRFTSEWLHTFSRGDFKIRGAYFNEDQDFDNRTADTVYHNAYQSFITEAELQYRPWRHHTFDLGINQSYFVTDVDAYQIMGINQYRQAFFGGYYWTVLPPLEFSTMLRQELVEGKATPFTFTSGLLWRAHPSVSFKAQLSKVYRTPTLNDLYWRPGGQTDLEAEYGYAQECTATWKSSGKVWDFSISFSAYNRQIKNWIVWLPRNGIWSPQNLQEVHSRGLESRSTVHWTSGHWKAGFHLSTQYVRSTHEKSSFSNDASVGKQLIYTPLYSGRSGIHLYYKKYSIRYQHQYTGYIYTASDHSAYLEPYHLGSIYCSYSPQWKRWENNFYLRIDNIWNRDYQVVRNRPMPGRQYSIGIHFNFKLKSTS